MSAGNYERRSLRGRCCSVRCPQRTASRVATSHVLSAETADATALLVCRSRPIDSHDFSRVRPVFCTSDESSTDGVLEDVIPFHRVALFTSQQAVVKAWLPEGCELLANDAHRLSARGGQRAVEVPFQSFHPVAQSDVASCAHAEKEMYVIRHDHVPTNTDAILRGASAVIGECIVHRGVRKNRLSPMRVEREEVNRRVEALEDKLEARWLTLDHPLHRRCCSVRSPQRTSLRAWRRLTKSAEDSGRYSTQHPRRAEGVRT
jgi:hypothetical protein